MNDFPNKEARALWRKLRKQGWAYCITNGNHVKFISPKGAPVIMAGSPSDQRALKAVRVQLRRLGAHL